MRRVAAILIALLALGLLLTGCGLKSNKAANETAVGQGSGDTQEKPGTLILATTTSTKDSGLLDVIIPDFEAKNNALVKVIALGTGEALKMGEEGEADVLLVHARASEDEFMAAGNGSVRKEVMYNDFVILGPETDIAGITGMDEAKSAMTKIAGAKAPFVTRGDDSGTHKKELALWKAAGITPAGDWYISTGQGMGESQSIANEKLAYILADRATYLAAKDRLELKILVEGDNLLLNPYGVIAVNPQKWPKVKGELSSAFIDWLTSVETQKIIGEYGIDKFGEALFTPNSDEWNAANKN